MPSARFNETLQKLSAADRKLVASELSLWKKKHSINGIDSAQLAENIESESSLPVTAFAKLLKSFAVQLRNNAGDISIWKTVCAAHEFHGPIIPASARPRRLGRVGKLKCYAEHLENIVGKFAASQQLTKNAGKSKPLSALVRQMHRANLSSGRVLWGTFSLPPETNPLTGLPQDTDGIATCLGLGFGSDPAPFIVIQYETSTASSLSLHKPTVADAGTYFFFRPSKNLGVHWGMTEPLKVNPKKLKGRPELVHSQITGQSLVFPYFISV